MARPEISDTVAESLKVHSVDSKTSSRKAAPPPLFPNQLLIAVQVSRAGMDHECASRRHNLGTVDGASSVLRHGSDDDSQWVGCRSGATCFAVADSASRNATSIGRQTPSTPVPRPRASCQERLISYMSCSVEKSHRHLSLRAKAATCRSAVEVAHGKRPGKCTSNRTTGPFCLEHTRSRNRAQARDGRGRGAPPGHRL